MLRLNRSVDDRFRINDDHRQCIVPAHVTCHSDGYLVLKTKGCDFFLQFGKDFPRASLEAVGIARNSN